PRLHRRRTPHRPLARPLPDRRHVRAHGGLHRQARAVGRVGRNRPPGASPRGRIAPTYATESVGWAKPAVARTARAAVPTIIRHEPSLVGTRLRSAAALS